MTLFLKQRDDKWDIMCESHGMTAIAGPRLFRAPPHPDIQFSGHESEARATQDCERLRTYLESLPKKKSGKTKQRQAEREVYQ